MEPSFTCSKISCWMNWIFSSNKFVVSQLFGSSCFNFFWSKSFLNNVTNFKEKHQRWSPYLITLQIYSLLVYFKKTLSQIFSCGFFLWRSVWCRVVCQFVTLKDWQMLTVNRNSFWILKDWKKGRTHDFSFQTRH